jgi:hypothetical protein
VCTPECGRGIGLSPENTDIYEEINPVTEI